jgi:hypothetical protein
MTGEDDDPRREVRHIPVVSVESYQCERRMRTMRAECQDSRPKLAPIGWHIAGRGDEMLWCHRIFPARPNGQVAYYAFPRGLG